MAKAKVDPATITGYCMKTKEKGVPIQNCVINRLSTAGGSYRYNALGDDGDGNKMSAILGKDKAEAAIKAGTAKKGKGWK